MVGHEALLTHRAVVGGNEDVSFVTKTLEQHQIALCATTQQEVYILQIITFLCKI